MKIKIMLIILFVLSCNVSAQTFSSEERKKEAESILNTVFNSSPFDSLYGRKRVYILANELLTVESPLELKRNNYRAIILDEDKVKKVRQYVVLGDFTLDWNKLSSARVQLVISPDRTLNMRLEKDDGRWIIKGHSIF